MNEPTNAGRPGRRAPAGRSWRALHVVHAWLALALLAGAQGARAGEGELESMRFVDLQARPVALEQLAGRPLLVNFWARWCVPCRAEMGLLERARREHPGLQVVGIALEDSAEAVGEFAAAYAVGYPLWLAGAQGEAALAAAGDREGALPYTLAYDAEGHVVFRHRGALEAARLAEAVALASQ